MNKETKILIGLGLATVVLIVFGSFFFTKGSSKPKENAKPVDASLLVKDEAYKRGKADSSITVVEFADFQCPACGAQEPIMRKIYEQYKSEVNFVFRHFPLPQHANANIAALASEAAGSQGKFWEMHDKLYDNQNEWSDAKDPMTIFLKYAADLGLNLDQFKKDVNDKTFQSRIDQGLTDGNAAGVDSTPTIFVNGSKQSGILTEPEFKLILDAALKTP